MAILLGLVAAFIELRFAFGVKFIRSLIEKSTVLGVVFSITLSIIIGAIFGAAGLVVMLGAMIATVITQPVYMVANKVKTTGIDVKDTINDVKNIFAPFTRMFKFAFKIIFFPFIITYKILKWNADRQQARVPA